MKTTFKILRIILILVFIAAFALIGISQMNVKEHEVIVEDTVGKDVHYYRDELYFFSDYYKYNDADGMQYWVSKATNKLDYVYNPAAETIDTTVSHSKAQDIAYDAAKEYDREFFKNDIIIETKDDSYYEFYIFQLDSLGYKNGKFIAVKVRGKEIEYVSMHTDYNSVSPELGMCISETAAIDTAYASTSESEFTLSSEDNHLIDTGFYKDSGRWIWEVKIYKITENEIENLTTAIEPENYFLTRIDASTGETITYEWIQNATDYCPLNGEIF